MRALAGGLAGALLLPGPALAHSPIPGIGGFYNGLLHPLLVPAHLLALVALGLWLGQQALPRIERALLAFSLLLLAGLALAAFAAPGGGQTSLLACALGVGLLVAAAWPSPPCADRGGRGPGRPAARAQFRAGSGRHPTR